MTTPELSVKPPELCSAVRSGIFIVAALHSRLNEGLDDLQGFPMQSAARITRSSGKSRPGSITFDDFCTLVLDGQKADLLNGVIHLASPDNIDAGTLFTWLFTLLENYVEETDVGQLFGQRIAFRLSENDGPEPDIAFVRAARMHLVQRGFFNGPPDIAIEIVSPDSVERDYEKKLGVYEDAGVPEYWIIDQDIEKFTMLSLNKRGKFHIVRPRQGKFHSRVLPGFWIDPAWLWVLPRPKKSTILSEILGPRL